MKKRSIIPIVMLIAVIGLTFITLNSFQQSPKGKYLGLQLYSLRDSIMKNVPVNYCQSSKMGYKFVEASRL